MSGLISDQVELAFNPDEPRGPDGRWIKGSQARFRELVKQGRPLMEALRIANSREARKAALRERQHASRRAAQQTWTVDDQSQIVRHAHPQRPNSLLGSPVPADRLITPQAARPAPGIPGQLMFPGMPDKIGHTSPPVLNLQTITRGDLLTGTSEHPSQGIQGDTEIVTLKNGSKVVHKTYSWNYEDMPDADELSYYVSQVIGAGAPPVARMKGGDPTEILMGYVPGVTAERYSEEDDEYALIGSDQGQKIGLLDYLIGNSDRHNANWMVSPDGQPVPIDNSSGFKWDEYGTDSEFWDASRRLSQQEYARLMSGLEALKPEFERLWHGDWYQRMIGRAEDLNPGTELGWRFNPAEARDPHGRWTKSGAGYQVPDTGRLGIEHGQYAHPSQHPFFQRNPVSSANVIKVYDRARPEQVAQGMRWYHDAHHIAKALAGGNAAKGAAVLSAYSPQTSWPVNMFNAARALELGRAIGPGEGMITGAMQKTAQKALDGGSLDDVFHSPKTRAFAHLIASGGDEPAEQAGHVVIDRHALSVATGRRMTAADVGDAPLDKARYYQHVADQYREAAAALRQRGTPVTPHQLQAITWLVQQEENQAADELAGQQGLGGRLAKGRRAAGRNAWDRWGEYVRQHHITAEPGTTAALSATTILGQILELAGTISGQGGWEHELRDAHGRWTSGVLEKVAKPITAAEARGNSRPVSHEEFQRLAARGRDQLRAMQANSSPPDGLTRNWDRIKAETYPKVQQSWGGATIDAHTGQALPDGADKYALSIKPEGQQSISVPEHADQAAFNAAMDRALAEFRAQLSPQQAFLGVFHDDDNARIDIDPVTVVGSLADVETIGAYTHAVGGAYHFRSGDGFWPPHVAEGASMANDQVHWAGPGQWRSAADREQPGLSPDQQAEIAAEEGISAQAARLSDPAASCEAQ